MNRTTTNYVTSLGQFVERWRLDEQIDLSTVPVFFGALGPGRLTQMEVEDASVTQLEAAIAESLEDVVRRAEQLQQHLVDLPGPSRLIKPGDVGSPERLRALALGTPYEPMRVASAGSTCYGAISGELVYDELAAEPYGDDDGVRSEATWIGP